LSRYIATRGPNSIEGARRYGRTPLVFGDVILNEVGKPRRSNAGLIYLVSFCDQGKLTASIHP